MKRGTKHAVRYVLAVFTVVSLFAAKSLIALDTTNNAASVPGDGCTYKWITTNVDGQPGGHMYVKQCAGPPPSTEVLCTFYPDWRYFGGVWNAATCGGFIIAFSVPSK
jgi:hypothetical protein